MWASGRQRTVPPRAKRSSPSGLPRWLSAAPPLTRYTSTTIDQPAALARELALVRQRGYAVNQEEWRQGVCAIAVPLQAAGGTVVASLSLTMPTERFKRAASRFLRPLRRAGLAIAAQLGEPGPIV